MTEPGNVDGVVVARAIAGDCEVLDDIFAALQRPLYRYISRLLTHRETAEDCLATGPEVLRPWAFRIASRECFRREHSRRNGSPVSWIG
jgi:DNA-directed RNA polymerase specialized sigma24 family protein